MDVRSRKLKASGRTSVAFSVRLIAVCVIVFALGMMTVVPLFAAALIFMFRYSPLDLNANIMGYLSGGVWSWWPTLASFGQIEPIIVSIIFYCVLFAITVVYVLGQTSQVSGRSIFGPAAVKTHEHGSAELDIDERVIAANTRMWDGTREDAENLHGGGVVYGYSSKFHKYYVGASDVHTLIVGIPGSGKTRRLLLPTGLALADCGDSSIWIDPKGELYAMLHRYYEQRGYNVLLLDFRNPRRSNLWNPLTSVIEAYERNTALAREHSARALDAYQAGRHDDSNGVNMDHGSYEYLALEADGYLAQAREDAEKFAKDISEIIIPMPPGSSPADFWNSSARGLICALILLVATYDRGSVERHLNRLAASGDTSITAEVYALLNELPVEIEPEQRSLETVAALLNTKGKARTVTRKGVRQTEIDLELVFDILPEGNIAKRAYAQAKNAKDETLASMIVTAQEKLNAITSEGFNAMSYTSEFSLADIAHERTAVFLVMPDESPAKNTPGLMFISMAYQTLVAEAIKQGGTLERRVVIMGEEIGNITTPIPRFPNMLAVSRQRNIIFNLVIQNFEQLTIPYGQAAADSIRDMCNVTIFLKTNSLRTATEISQRLGKYTYRETSSSSSSRNLTWTEGTSGQTSRLATREWLTPDEVLEWNNKEFGNIVFRADADAQATGLTNMLYGRPITHPALFPTPDISQTPTEKALGLGSREYNQKLWRADELIDRRGTRVHVTPWLALNTREDQLMPDAVAQPGHVSSRVRDLMAEISEEQGRTVSVASRKANAGDVEQQLDRVQIFAKQELIATRRMAKQICALGGVEYAAFDKTSASYAFAAERQRKWLGAQKKAIEGWLATDKDYQWEFGDGEPAGDDEGEKDMTGLDILTQPEFAEPLEAPASDDAVPSGQLACTAAQVQGTEKEAEKDPLDMPDYLYTSDFARP